MGMPIADVIGLPTYFIDTAVPENAGDGNVRVFNCQTRNGVLLPQCIIYIHATKLIVAGKIVTDAAQDAFNQEMMGVGLRH